MKKGALVWVIGLVFIFGIVGFVSAFSGTGDGSSGMPYIITNCTQLQEMKDSLYANYSLGNNVNCSDTLNWNAGAGFAPVSTFTGSLNGQLHKITGIYINKPLATYVGLFGFMDGSGGNGIIKDIGLVDVNITGQSQVGGLVGSIYIGSVNNSYVSGNVVGSDGVGGLVGVSLGGVISNSFVSGNVSGNQNIGGLLGRTNFNYGGQPADSIINSYATGNVYGTGGQIGGLVGYLDNGPVTNSYATGSVICYGCSAIGGLVGWSSNGAGNITNSYATGSVIGNSDVGGLVGSGGRDIDNSYATGNVTGTDYVGGLVGAGDAVFNSYAIGNVIGNGIKIGGLAGSISVSVNNSYWYDWGGDNATDCYDGGDENCTRINNTNGGITYFNTIINAPLSSWDFTNIWLENATNPPALRNMPLAPVYFGGLTVSLVGMANATVNRGSSFVFSSNVSCSEGACENVSAYLDPVPIENAKTNFDYKTILIISLVLALLIIFVVVLTIKKSIYFTAIGIIIIVSIALAPKFTGFASNSVVSTTAGATPFYTNSANPSNCGVLADGENCANTWTVVASGSAATYKMFVKYNSTTAGVGEKNTSSVYITINVPIVSSPAAPEGGGGYIVNGKTSTTPPPAETSNISNETLIPEAPIINKPNEQKVGFNIPIIAGVIILIILLILIIWLKYNNRSKRKRRR